MGNSPPARLNLWFTEVNFRFLMIFKIRKGEVSSKLKHKIEGLGVPQKAHKEHMPHRMSAIQIKRFTFCGTKDIFLKKYMR